MDDARRPDPLLARLAAIPDRIARAVAGWSEAELRAAPTAGEWSAADILAHLRASADIMTPRIYMVLVRDRPPLPAYDDRRWAQIAGYAGLEFGQSLALFTLRRVEVVAMLRRVSPEDWARSGVHEEQGTTSLLELVGKLVEHEEEHGGQLEAIRGARPER
jgi:hypothetical protein